MTRIHYKRLVAEGFGDEDISALFRHNQRLFGENKMSKIAVEQKPGEDRLKTLGVMDWPIWTKEVSKFPWTYDEQEICYFLEGEVVVTPDGGAGVEIRAGDLVTFPAGMSCTWDIRVPVRKHYRFG